MGSLKDCTVGRNQRPKDNFNHLALKTAEASQHVEDFDLALVASSVTREVEQLVERVAVAKNSLQNVQCRVSALHGSVLDEGVNTMGAMRSAFLAKVRLLEAERAISRALGAAQQYVTAEQHIAKQERDAARNMAAQVKLRVEILRLFQADGVGSVLKTTYLRLEDSLLIMSSELKDLAKYHQNLRNMVSENKETVLHQKKLTQDEKFQLEARWMNMSCTLDSWKEKMETCKLTPYATPSEKQISLTETQERLDSVRQLCLEAENAKSLV